MPWTRKQGGWINVSMGLEQRISLALSSSFRPASNYAYTYLRLEEAPAVRSVSLKTSEHSLYKITSHTCTSFRSRRNAHRRTTQTSAYGHHIYGALLRQRGRWPNGTTFSSAPHHPDPFLSRSTSVTSHLSSIEVLSQPVSIWPPILSAHDPQRAFKFLRHQKEHPANTVHKSKAASPSKYPAKLPQHRNSAIQPPSHQPYQAMQLNLHHLIRPFFSNLNYVAAITLTRTTWASNFMFPTIRRSQFHSFFILKQQPSF